MKKWEYGPHVANGLELSPCHNWLKRFQNEYFHFHEFAFSQVISLILKKKMNCCTIFCTSRVQPPETFMKAVGYGKPF